MGVGYAWSVSWAQDQTSSSEESCRNTTVTSVPARPTVTFATDVTQCGVVEFEYGLERQWPGRGADRDDLTGGIRFGITPNLDFHWASSDFVHLNDANGGRTGFGDTWLGLRYRFLKQRKYVPSIGAYYAAKIPSASIALGLGSGQVDHSITFLASKDIRRFHFDLNVIELLIGRPDAPGSDHNTGFAFATWVPITRRFNLVLEPYGYTALNQSTPAFASTTLGFNFKVKPSLYLDTGLDMGVTSGAPQRRVFIGFTYAAANVYAWLRPQRP